MLPHACTCIHLAYTSVSAIFPVFEEGLPVESKLLLCLIGQTDRERSPMGIFVSQFVEQIISAVRRTGEYYIPTTSLRVDPASTQEVFYPASPLSPLYCARTQACFSVNSTGQYQYRWLLRSDILCLRERDGILASGSLALDLSVFSVSSISTPSAGTAYCGTLFLSGIICSGPAVRSAFTHPQLLFSSASTRVAVPASWVASFVLAMRCFSE